MEAELSSWGDCERAALPLNQGHQSEHGTERKPFVHPSRRWIVNLHGALGQQRQHCRMNPFAGHDSS